MFTSRTFISASLLLLSCLTTGFAQEGRGGPEERKKATPPPPPKKSSVLIPPIPAPPAVTGNYDVKEAWYQVKGVQSGRCLDITATNSDNGAKLQLWDCTPENKNPKAYVQKTSENY